MADKKPRTPTRSRRRRPRFDLIARCQALVAQQTTTIIVQYEYFRGHPVVCLQGEAGGRYATDLAPTAKKDGSPVERPCVHCGVLAAPDGPDPCLGWLPGVRFACCGHGVEESYVMRDDASGPVLRGQAALAYFTQHGVGPGALSREPAVRHEAGRI